MTSGFSGVPVWKEDIGSGISSVVKGSPGSQGEKQFPFFECIWEWWQGLSVDIIAGWLQHAALITNIRTKTPAEGSYPG